MTVLRMLGLVLGLLALEASQVREATAQTTSVTGAFTGGTTQMGRIFRDGIPSACPSKAYPGVFNPATTYNVETHSFPNAGATTCVEIAFDPNAGATPCGTNAHASAYLNAYDPGNQAANFIGDVGSSVTQSFFVEVPAGETLIVVVSNTAAQAICDYAFDVIGLTVGVAGTSTVEATQAVIRNFLNRRANLITASGPETREFHKRFTGSLFGDDAGDAAAVDELADRAPPAPQYVSASRNDLSDAGGAAFGALRADTLSTGPLPGETSATGDGDDPVTEAITASGHYLDGRGAFSFGTSLSRLSRAEAIADSSGGVQVSQGDEFWGGRFNVWTEGEISFYRDELGSDAQEGTFAIVYAGADYLVHPGVLVGALVQVDWMGEESDLTGVSVDGLGWMAGPYVSISLTPNLFLDARAAWGRSSNEVSPFGTYEDSFDTYRSLYSAKITGLWRDGPWLFMPDAEVVYFEETQQRYTDSNGLEIGEQTVSLGRVIFGPEVAYEMDWQNQGRLELSAGVKGLWDFEKDDDSTVNGVVVGRNDFQGRLEFGADYTAPSNISTRLGVSYLGLGDSDFEAYQLELLVHIPF